MMRNYRELTDEEVAELERLYPVTPNRRLSQQFGISVDAIVDHLAKDQTAIKLTIRGTYHELTEREEQWIVRHYHNTPNGDIMVRFGIGESQLIRVRRKHGLKKTDRFMRRMRREAVSSEMAAMDEHGLRQEAAERARKAWAERKASGDYGRVGFRKGESNKDRMSPRRFKAHMAKVHATRNETIRRDRIRIHFGLEPKTKLVRNWDAQRDWHRPHYRSKFREYGYDVEPRSCDVYYRPDTRRHPVMERNAAKWGFRFWLAKEEDNEHEFHELNE